MISYLRRCLARLARRRHDACPWLADALRALAQDQRRIAAAARSVVQSGRPDSLEDLLCGAELLGERLAELCERAAAIAALRALQAHAGRRDDPGVAS